MKLSIQSTWLLVYVAAVVAVVWGVDEALLAIIGHEIVWRVLLSNAIIIGAIMVWPWFFETTKQQFIRQ